MDKSIHDQVTPTDVARATSVPVPVVEVVLEAQRRAIAMCQANNGVVILPGVTLRHRGDRLGQWLADLDASDIPDAVWPRVDQELEASPDALAGTTLARLLGCRDDLLEGRDVWSLVDLAPVIVQLAERNGVLDVDAVERVLEAFWDRAEPSATSWVWPYDRVAMERDIEDWLEQNLEQLRRFGLTVRLAELDSSPAARQWRNADGSSRLDLLLEVTEAGTTVAEADGVAVEIIYEVGDLVVVELKAVPLAPADVDQIQRYVRVVEAEVSRGRRVWGFLIGAGWTDSFVEALNAADGTRLGWLSISQLGFFDEQLGFAEPER